MPEVTDQPAKPEDHRDRRLYVWWGVSLALLAMLGVFCWTVVVPVVNVRSAVGQLSTAGKWAEDLTGEHIRRLGGPSSAARKLALYVRLPVPDRWTPHKSYAVALMGYCGVEATPHLSVVLRSGDDRSRSAVARMMGDLGDKRAVEPLIRALGDEDEYVPVRYFAAEALGKLGDQRAVEQLIRALGDEYVPVRFFAAEALGKLGDQRAVDPLIGALRDDSPDVRGFSAESLGQLGNSRAVPLLKAIEASDSDGRARSEARTALWRLGAWTPVTRPEARSGVPKFIADLAHESVEVRDWAALHLRDLGPEAEEAVPALIKALRDPEAEIRRIAASALGRIGSKAASAAPALKMLLEDENETVRQAAAEALEKIRGEKTEG